jgi:hypothetical protein
MSLADDVRAKLNGGRITITTDLVTWSAEWTRRCSCGASDARRTTASSEEDLLRKVLAWEAEADASYAAAGCEVPQ